MIAGRSQREKTTFTKLLLQYADVLFERPICKIVYCYGQWQECFQDMASQITFVEGIPEDIPALFPMGCRPGILVLDDLIVARTNVFWTCSQKCLIIVMSPAST